MYTRSADKNFPCAFPPFPLSLVPAQKCVRTAVTRAARRPRDDSRRELRDRSPFILLDPPVRHSTLKTSLFYFFESLEFISVQIWCTEEFFISNSQYYTSLIDHCKQKLG